MLWISKENLAYGVLVVVLKRKKKNEINWILILDIMCSYVVVGLSGQKCEEIEN